jgi:hypothetical protein
MNFPVICLCTCRYMSSLGATRNIASFRLHEANPAFNVVHSEGHSDPHHDRHPEQQRFQIRVPKRQSQAEATSSSGMETKSGIDTDTRQCGYARPTQQARKAGLAGKAVWLRQTHDTPGVVIHGTHQYAQPSSSSCAACSAVGPARVQACCIQRATRCSTGTDIVLRHQGISSLPLLRPPLD